jgi:hypothetical protein
VIAGGVQAHGMSLRATVTTIAAHLLGAAALLLVAGCGGGGSPAPAGARAAVALDRGDRAMIQFTGCMRAHGVAMSDPYHRAGHAGLTLDLPEQAPTNARAYAACGPDLQPIVQEKEAHAPAITAAVRLALIHYAECMRRHGVPMLDPTPQGALALGNVPGVGPGTGRYSPQFHTADRACRALLPPTVHDDGTGP